MKNRLWFLFGGHKLDLFEISYVGKADKINENAEFSFIISGRPVDMTFDNLDSAQKARNVLCGELDKIQKLMREAVQAERSDLILPKGVKQ